MKPSITLKRLPSLERERMKVLIVSSFTGQYGGIEAFVLALAKALKSSAGCSVTVCLKKTSNYHIDPNCIDAFKSSGIVFQIVPRGSWTLIQEIHNCDIVHAQNSPPDVALICKLLRKPLVLTVHNWRRESRTLRCVLNAWAARSAALRLYVSKFVESTWSPVVRTSESSDQVVPTVSDLPKGTVSPNQRSGFVFVGRWIPNKGLEVLVEAYLLARIEHSKWPLKLIGTGPLKTTIEAMLSGRSDINVQMLGFVTDDVKHEVIRRSLWLVAPANTREDLGLTPIEARSVGVPSIVTDDGGLPEAAGPSAIVVEPGNVAALVKAIEEAAAMSEDEYLARAHSAESSLEDFLQPMTFYENQYMRFVKR